MFSSHKSLKRKTPCPGINREEFIGHLVDEYYTTNNIECQEQVSANLANFAYDPINWNYLKKADAVKLFFELLETPNEKLQLHGVAGLCNISLDKEVFSYITDPEKVNILHKLILTTNNEEILLSCCTLIYQLLSSENSRRFLPGEVLKRIQQITNSNKTNKRLGNITSLLLLDFGRRYELLKGPSK